MILEGSQLSHAFDIRSADLRIGDLSVREVTPGFYALAVDGLSGGIAAPINSFGTLGTAGTLGSAGGCLGSVGSMGTFGCSTCTLCGMCQSCTQPQPPPTPMPVP
jgi:hypothetical protein